MTCTHLHWKFHQSEVRERQVVAACDRVLARRRQGGFPPLLIGDFNAEPESAEIRYVTGLQSLRGRSVALRDAWRAAGKGGSGITWSNANDYARLNLEPDRRIDYVFAGFPRRNGIGQITHCRVVCNEPKAGVWPSDHFGVYAELRAVPLPEPPPFGRRAHDRKFRAQRAARRAKTMQDGPGCRRLGLPRQWQDHARAPPARRRAPHRRARGGGFERVRRARHRRGAARPTYAMTTSSSRAAACAASSPTRSSRRSRRCASARSPDRIVIETSGVALPFETQLQLWRDPVRQWIADDVAVVVVNAEQLAEARDLDDTFTQQVSSADFLLLNQIDRVPAAALPRLERELRRVGARGAARCSTVHAQVAPELLFPPDLAQLRAQRRPRAASARRRTATLTTTPASPPKSWCCPRGPRGHGSACASARARCAAREGLRRDTRGAAPRAGRRRADRAREPRRSRRRPS